LTAAKSEKRECRKVQKAKQRPTAKQTTNKQSRSQQKQQHTCCQSPFLFVLVFLGPEGKKGNKDAKSAG